MFNVYSDKASQRLYACIYIVAKSLIKRKLLMNKAAKAIEMDLW